MCRDLQSVDGGNSSSYLFITSNKKIVIKIIEKEEKKNLLCILPSYFKKMFSNPQSKIVKIFGLFQILPEKINIIIMENLLNNRNDLIIFDLKGSMVNRYTHIDKFPIVGKCLKDQNFINSGVKLKINGDNIIFNTLIEDFKFLSSINIIDYSLLIGIPITEYKSNGEVDHSDLIKIGIIDITQKYNFKKASEKQIKSIFYKAEEISITDPVSYQTRFINFLNKVFS